ncbi:DUF421 domain-containing protein [Spirosoma luteolum]
MDKLLGVDWETMFVPSSSVAEMLIRGSLTYWFCFLYIRFFRRSSGQLMISDILLITLISDAAQNAMAGTYESVTEGVVLVGTLVGWDYALNWLGYRSMFVNRISTPEPALLVHNGVLQRQTMKRELISEEELLGLLRINGIDDPADVKTCYLEGSGSVSVVPKK